MMTTAKTRSLITIVLCLGILGVASGQKVSFPGTKSETRSPDGRYIVKNIDDEHRRPAHRLSVIDTRDGSATEVYSYGRHVDVLWSPTSEAVVVNDYQGSNVSRPVFFRAPWTDQPVDLKEKLIDFLRSQGRAKGLVGNHHVYFLARRWLNDREILCRLTGYGEVNPEGFTRDYVYKIGEGFRLK